MILHIPVLLKEICSYIPKEAKVVVDGTLGHGGHSKAMLEILSKDAKIIGIDLDEIMLAKAKEQTQNDPRMIYEHNSYANITDILDKNGYSGVDAILLDLGVNLEHFRATERGFSVKGDAPLDMRFDTSKGKPLKELLKTLSSHHLQEIFEKYADFTPPKAKELAEALSREEKRQPLETTFQLKELLGQHGLGEKAATVIFQALRIYVNQELINVEKVLQQIPQVLNPGGRCIIMSYHSGEDRLVKQTFKELCESGNFELLTKKAIQADYKEKAKNKASRSVKVRVIEKII